MKASIVHLLDIAFCAVVLRLIFGWLFEYRRLVRLLVAMAVLMGVVYAVYRLALPFASLLTVVLILPIAVIAFLSFLPELGRIYQSASRGNIFGFRRGPNMELIPVLKATLSELARKKKGALFVLERSDPVDTLVTGGEAVDALFNKALILSIFDPNCPRHDGAVVIKNDRIIRMGGVLPLATADGADERYGTRHLAAIGLTELCDADVLVVSEERGVISHSRQGHITTVDPEQSEQVEEMLKSVLGAPTNQAHRRRPGTLSLVLWIFALGLAAAGSFSLENIRERFFSQPAIVTSVEARIAFEGLPENLFVDSLDQASCRLFIRMPQNAVLDQSMILAVDLKGKQPGKISLNLGPAMVRNLPRQAEIERFDPERISFVLAEAKPFEIGVDPPRFTGLAPDLSVGQVSYQPSVVKAVVRDVKWKKSNTLRLLPVNLAGFSKPGDYTLSVPVDVPGSVQPLNGAGVPTVKVTVELLKR